MRARGRIPFIFITLLSLLFGCDKPPKVSENKLFLNLSQDPGNLDPRIARSISELTLSKQLFEGLMRLDNQGEPQCAIAASYQISSDSKEYLFTLKDAFWSNGDKVTAYDFEYAWKRVLNPDFATVYAHMLFVIKNGKAAKLKKASFDSIGIKAIDEKTLKVELEEPTAYFLELLSFPTYFPVHAGLDQKDPNWPCKQSSSFISNGPYRLSKWESNSLIELEKNSHYWDQKNVHLDALSLSILPDAMTENYLFEKGELDWLGQPLSQNIPPEAACRYKEEGKLLSYPVAGTYWIQCNTRKPPFDNVKMRKAFALALSRSELISHILQGNQKPALELLPPTMGPKTPYFSDGDTSQAIALFDEALAELHLTRETFPKVVLSFPSTERDIKIAEYLQERWRVCFNVTISLDITERKCFKSKVRAGEFQLAQGEWIADFNDPISFLELFKFRGGINTTEWENGDYIALLNRASIEPDVEKRSAILKQAEELLMDQMVVMPLYHYAFDYVKQPTVADVTLSALGVADFKCAKKR